jgi:hypothetical protein
MLKTYVGRPVRHRELRSLAGLARAEEERFFRDNAHLIAPYRERLVATALCQGAALQVLGCGYGVNDFDVHFFYRQNPAKPRLTRTRKRIFTNVGKFNDIPVDFLRTVIPTSVDATSRVELIRAFLRRSPTSNAKYLAQKAVVGLWPEKIYGITIWKAAD